VFLGNESSGLDPTLGRRLHGSLAIPMEGRAESLNVGVASAVLCFEASRQRRATAAAARSISPNPETGESRTRHGD
jgi:TrmH family RNA methyltransferase